MTTYSEPQTKRPLPKWAWIFPILFGFPGGLISWICFRKRQSAGWLMGVGAIVQFIANAITW